MNVRGCPQPASRDEHAVALEAVGAAQLQIHVSLEEGRLAQTRFEGVPGTDVRHSGKRIERSHRPPDPEPRGRRPAAGRLPQALPCRQHRAGRRGHSIQAEPGQALVDLSEAISGWRDKPHDEIGQDETQTLFDSLHQLLRFEYRDTSSRARLVSLPNLNSEIIAAADVNLQSSPKATVLRKQVLLLVIRDGSLMAGLCPFFVLCFKFERDANALPSVDHAATVQSSESMSVWLASHPVNTFLSAVNMRMLPRASNVSPPTSDSITSRNAGSWIAVVGIPSPAGRRKRNMPFPFHPSREIRFPCFSASRASPNVIVSMGLHSELTTHRQVTPKFA